MALLLATPPLAGCGSEPDAAEAQPGVEQAAPSASSARASDSGDAELRELAEYELTVPAVRRFAQAAEELDRLSATHPQLEEDIDADEASLDTIERQISSIPAARRAIEDAGLTPREYVVIGFVLMQAAFAQMAEQSGADPATFAEEAGINPANVEFMKEHADELQIFGGHEGAAGDEDGS